MLRCDLPYGAPSLEKVVERTTTFLTRDKLAVRLQAKTVIDFDESCKINFIIF